MYAAQHDEKQISAASKWSQVVLPIELGSPAMALENILMTHKCRGSLKSSMGSITQIYSSTQGEHKNTSKTLAIETSL